MLCDRDCEASYESTTTTAQRLSHSEYALLKQFLIHAGYSEVPEGLSLTGRAGSGHTAHSA